MDAAEPPFFTSHDSGRLTSRAHCYWLAAHTLHSSAREGLTPNPQWADCLVRLQYSRTTLFTLSAIYSSEAFIRLGCLTKTIGRCHGAFMDDFEFFEDDAESVRAAALTQQS